jgi:hypothetical protein
VSHGLGVGKTRPLCEAVLWAEPAGTGLRCICRWPDSDGEGWWWVEVDAQGTAYTSYERYLDLPF